MFNPFKKKIAFDFSELKTDVHSHLIPGIDDGVKTIDEAVEVVKKFEELGYQKLITTPHVMEGTYNNTPEIIYDGLEKLKEELRKQNVNIQLFAAAEYYYDDYFLNLIEKEKLMTFGDNFVLFEFPFAFPPNGVKELIFSLKSKGYKPVLAHFERYAYYHGSLSELEFFRNQGVKIQLNLVSLSGRYGKGVKNQAKKMIDSKLVDFVSTDCHRMEHLEIIENERFKNYFKKINELTLINRTL